MPGAQLTGVDGDVYRGKVRVKVGPVISEFTGSARFTEKDDAAHRGVIDAKGRDARSAGNAAALVTAVLRPDGDRTTVSVDTDLKISGKLAQIGSGMIKEVSGKLLAEFVANLEAKLAADEGTPTHAGTAPPATVSKPSSPAEPVTPPAEPASPVASPAAVETAAETAFAAAPAAVPDPAPVPAASQATPRPAATVPAAVAGEPEPLDLLDLAGGSIYKRAVPVIAGLVVAGAVIAWLIARR
jgi:carbon monoxide dehydrogenase subunit G